MFKTLSDLTQDVIKNVGLVTGTGVQTYTEPLVKQSIQRQFDLLFRKRFWEWMSDWTTVTPDGTTGLITGDLSSVIKFIADIKIIIISGENRRVVPPVDREHLFVSGSAPLYYTPLKFTHTDYVTKLLKFWPITATSPVDIYARTKPIDFIDTDTVPFPADVIAHAAAWDLLDSDGINPTAAQKEQALFDISYRDLIDSLSSDAIGHGGHPSNVPLTIRTL